MTVVVIVVTHFITEFKTDISKEMDIKRKYVKMFLDLNNEEKGVLAFTASKRYGLEIDDVMSFLAVYKEKGYVKCDDDYRITITEEGRAALERMLSDKRVESYTKGSDYFDEMKKESRMGIYEPYIPKVDFLLSGKKQKGNTGEA